MVENQRRNFLITLAALAVAPLAVWPAPRQRLRLITVTLTGSRYTAAEVRQLIDEINGTEEEK